MGPRPDRTVILIDKANRDSLLEMRPELENYGPVKGETAVYVCENFACKLPVTDPGLLPETLETSE